MKICLFNMFQMYSNRLKASDVIEIIVTYFHIMTLNWYVEQNDSISGENGVIFPICRIMETEILLLIPIGKNDGDN